MRAVVAHITAHKSSYKPLGGSVPVQPHSMFRFRMVLMTDIETGGYG